MKKVLFTIVALVLAIGLAVPMAIPAAADPGPGIVGLWHFDGNANDSSGTIPPNNGTVSGATYVASPMGQALSFDGDDYVTVSDSNSLDITGAITIEAWIYPTDVGVGVGAYRGIVAKRYGNFANYALRLDDGGRLDFYYSGPSATNAATDWNVWHTTDRVISANSWHHVAVTFTFAGGPIAAYVNGSPVSGAWYAGGPTDPATANDYALRIGMAYPGYPQYFKGLIDEVRIWNEALTAAQIGDISPPVVTITAPANGAYYKSADVPAGAYTVSDANSYTVVESGWSTAEGAHTYTVTATDVLGYVGSDSVTYYVLENFVTGGGNIKTGKTTTWTFGGNVGLLDDTIVPITIVGQFQIVDHTGKQAVAWHCNNAFTSLTFSAVPTSSPPAHWNVATFTGTFTSNKGGSAILTVIITDVGEPGTQDTIVVTGDFGFSGTPISGGNFQVHD